MRTDFTAKQLSDPGTATAAGAIRSCVHCGFCNATCPTYTLLGDELDGPRGRVYLMKEMLEKEQVPQPEVVKHIDRCLSCLACTTTCPSGVDYMHLVDHARSYVEQRYRRPWHERLIRHLLARVLPYRSRFRAALVLARLGRWAVPLLDRVRGLSPLAEMIRLAPQTITKTLPGSSSQIADEKGRVVLLMGCAEPVLKPEYRNAAMRLLNRVGYNVINPTGEGCCGALVHHMGRDHDSHAAARRNVDAWTRQIEQGGLSAIVVTASGCGTALKDYGFLLRDDADYAEKAARVSSLTRDISEFLSEVGLPAATPRDLTVAYHSACSLQHGQKVITAPVALLREAGFRVSIPPEAHLCCGSAGTYNILQPDIAARLGRRKASNLHGLGADVIAAGNIGCAMQIGRFADTPIVHTVELLDWATGGPRPPDLSALPKNTE